MKLVNAIIEVETGGNCTARGKSGEYGCMQFLSSTWRLFSKEVYGEVREQTPERERYVATQIIEMWMEDGHSAFEVALKWNGGTPTVKKGVNKYGVEYDTGAYARRVVALASQ